MTKNTITLLKKYFSRFPATKYHKGDIIYKPGDKIKHISYVKSGFVRLYIKNGSHETTLNLFRPLFMVTMSQIMSSHPNNFYVEALTPCEIWNAPKDEFLNYLHADIKLNDKLMGYFFNSVMQLLNNQTNIISGNATNKVASVLLQLAFDYGQVKENHLQVPFPATHRVLATLIGLTRETTSVQMSKLQKMGIITTKRASFTVLSLDKLKKLSLIKE
ncbi:MAG TPA: Crp/Fnr family transcriptional regulator [Patescibacteria group bacterium]